MWWDVTLDWYLKTRSGYVDDYPCIIYDNGNYIEQKEKNNNSSNFIANSNKIENGATIEQSCIQMHGTYI